MIQPQLPIFPKETTPINECLAFVNQEGTVYYFNGHMPIFSHSEEELASFRMFTSQLYINGNCKQREIVEAFGVTIISVKRSVKQYREKGAASFFHKNSPKRHSKVFTEAVKQKAQKLLYEGSPIEEITKLLNIRKDTFNKAINSGRLIVPQKKR